MKLYRNLILLTLTLGAGGAWAQSNTVPGSTDYAAFSKFVADRNIFDPNRQPHYTASRSTRTRTTHSRSSSAPAFSFVGTMAYEKGLFAFFSGNSDELKQVLPAAGEIAGYTVKEISPASVVLESSDKKEKLELKVGDVMRQENGKWELSGPGEVSSATSSTPSPEASASSNSTDNAGSSSAPASASEPNDILKRLMEKRAKENQ